MRVYINIYARACAHMKHVANVNTNTRPYWSGTVLNVRPYKKCKRNTTSRNKPSGIRQFRNTTEYLLRRRKFYFSTDF